MLGSLALLGAALAALPAAREALRTPAATWRDRSDSPSADLPQGVTRYDWHGPVDGPVVVCIHGLTTPSFVWDAMIPLLTQTGQRVLRYDLLGRGLSDTASGAQDAAFFVTQLETLLADQAVTGPITVMGYSMGGAVATAFAAKHRDRIRHLVLLAPAGMGHDLGPLAHHAARWPVLGDWAFHMGFVAGHKRTARTMAVPDTLPTFRSALLEQVTRRGYVASVLASIRGILAIPQEAEHRAIAAAGIPVTALWGDLDTVIALENRDRLRVWNPNARHAVIYGADHSLPITHADAVLACLPLHR